MGNKLTSVKKPLIAVIDDEQDLLDNFESLLSEQFQIQTFSSPFKFLEALPSLEKNGLRLVITDFKMPKMNGLEMVQKGHQSFRFPFIILSGHLEKQTVMDAVEIGVFRLLEKPTNHEDLLATIDQLLLEGDLQNVRNEIRTITSQLREIYSTMRLVLSRHLTPEMQARMVVETKEDGGLKKMGFEDLLERLEHRLDTLLKSEKVMSDLKQERWKASS